MLAPQPVRQVLRVESQLFVHVAAVLLHDALGVQSTGGAASFGGVTEPSVGVTEPSVPGLGFGFVELSVPPSGVPGVVPPFGADS
jgi:hypothetical protein